uniref:CS domain-containing protein n=1 Tax=Grammatophora oceanica TaxID=210454 RepID=A0A7S1UPZ0_9STRA|mmetsp:Transcript_16553/g.24479  ORF Transcript_16553/g.24479 Transcript_16553/m.24479 type:complete len:220 (+) Transcript_16553:102-761(+)
MSKLSDYSKFDHLVDSDDEEEERTTTTKTAPDATGHEPQSTQTSPPAPGVPADRSVTRKDPKTGRYIFEHNGHTVYEWEQSLEDVTMYIPTPPGTTGSKLLVDISSRHLKVGLKGHDRYFLDEPTFGKVDTTESSWYVDDDDGVLTVVLQKVKRAEAWETVLLGVGDDVVDPMTKRQMQKDLLLERFQEENPGMDFRNAEFNGSIPDARTFMGGVGYDN